MKDDDDCLKKKNKQEKKEDQCHGCPRGLHQQPYYGALVVLISDGLSHLQQCFCRLQNTSEKKNKKQKDV